MDKLFTCRCGNAFLLHTTTVEIETGVPSDPPADPVLHYLCPLCGTLYEYNPEIKSWAAFAWNGSQWKARSD